MCHNSYDMCHKCVTLSYHTDVHTAVPMNPEPPRSMAGTQVAVEPRASTQHGG